MSAPLQLLAWLMFLWLATLVFAALCEAAMLWVRRYRRYYQCIRELNGMSDHELKDIGITRGDIYRVAREELIEAAE